MLGRHPTLAIAFGLLANACLCPPAPAQDAPPRIDYLSFAAGAIPLTVGGDPAARSTFEYAVYAIDGGNGSFVYTTLVDPAASVEFVYELPAPTAFNRFAVPNVLETPSPSQTFARDIAVHGSAMSAAEGFVQLAHATLATHSNRNDVSELTIDQTLPVRWVKLVLGNGIDVQRDKMFLEFTEIIGNGTQDVAPLATTFGGGWQGRGVAMLFAQDGPLVAGCYDGTGDLQGTVDGRVLRATGVDRNDGTRSVFIATVGDDGTMRGVRSTNGAPFRLFNGTAASNVAALRCAEPAAPTLGCGSVIHGIRFDFDSAVLRPESAAIIDNLHTGLARAGAASIVIEGHTSSEGNEAYNQNLSERRAGAVREALIARGIGADLLTATGIGEGRPIANNDDENGRSLNRRVEVRCGSTP
jgi:outer membrane protein OmpA-like peptidoglycan-associated protein